MIFVVFFISSLQFELSSSLVMHVITAFIFICFFFVLSIIICPDQFGYSTNVYTGRLRPEVQPLTLLYTIFHEKGTPFVYLLLTKGAPFKYLV